MNDDVEEFADNIQSQIQEMVLKTANRIKQILVKNTILAMDEAKINATGNMRKGTDGTILEYATFVVVTVFTNAFYSIYRHEGTKPHMPPIESIYQWVKTRRLTGKYSLKTHKRLGSKLTQYKQDMSLAWAIAKKISKKGTLGVKFFEIALKQSWPQIEKEISKLNFQGA